MIKCQNCGHNNADDCNFCRFCGTKVIAVPTPQQQPAPRYDIAPPRPYAWKTDEFQTQAEPRHNSSANAPAPFQPAAASYPQYAAMSSYHCPRCGTTYLPVIEKRVSSAGWVVFSVLLIFTLVFFWIGLMMREEVAVCPVCRARLN